MRIRLWHRLFLALGALAVLALGALLFLQQRDFKAGFLGYVNRLTLEQLEMAAVRLGEAHAETGSWEAMRNDRRRFRQIILNEDADGARRGPPPYLEDRPGEPREAGDREPGDRPPPRDRPPRPRFDGPGGQDGRPPPPRRPGDAVPLPPRRQDRPDGANIMPRVLLIDTRGEPVLGNPDIPRSAPSLPVNARGVEVGRLLMQPIPELTRELDTGFAQAQARHAGWIAAGVLGVALLTAWALARWLLRPVGELARGTRSLAEGNFSVRLKDARGDELGDLARHFNHLAAALEQSRDARRQWGADIAHELRTPLAVLKAEIHALEDGVRKPTPEAMASLRAECDRLGGLVDDLYQLALSDRGALEYRMRAMDLAGVIREVTELHRHALSEVGIALELAPLPALPVLGDAARLGQLFNNLLSNCARYTDSPGRVRVEATHNAGRLNIVIEDSAPGVPDAALPRLFERLYRVDSARTRDAGGAGLGLSIARSIVDAHGGQIRAEHSSLGGVRITIDLPAGRA